MLKGKKAIVTGGSRGIGSAIALELAKEGADIAVIYSGSQAGAEAVCAQAAEYGVTAKAYKCDVANFAQVKEVCDTIAKDLGGVDILVNNAGITKDNLILRMSEEDFDAVLDVNLKGAFNFIKHLSRPIMKSSAGRIINIASVSGLMGNAGQVNYAASKAGLVGLTKSVAKELAARKVTCNAVAPGFVETDMTAELPEAVTEYVNKSVPLRRMGKVEEIAGLVAFLASDKASYITGEVIRADGGMCM